MVVPRRSGALCVIRSLVITMPQTQSSVAEEEWCSMCDKIGDDEEPDPRFWGRAAGPKYKWGQVLPRCDGSLGRNDDVGLGLSYLARLLSEMAAIISSVARRGFIA